MIKNFVFDTNVLLYDTQSVLNFSDNNIIIPVTVIEEIDQFKKDLNEIGRNARYFSRFLDHLRSQGSLATGVRLESGGTLRVIIGKGLSQKLSPEQFPPNNDHKILSVALVLQEEDPNTPVILVTKDTNLRIKADALDLTAEDYTRDRVEISELYTGMDTLGISADAMREFLYKGFHPLPESEFYPHTCVTLKEEGNSHHTALGRYLAHKQMVVALKQLPPEGLWGIKPRNYEQQFAVDLLLDDRIKLVSLTGVSGTGKTLLALAAGLIKTSDEEIYQRLLVSRPIFPLGRDLGYLPGDVEEKLRPWMQPIFDNVQLLLDTPLKKREKRRSLNELTRMGLMEIEPLTYIRGRSLANQYLIVDEAQNLTPHEIKTIVTRAGEGTKIVLTGDPYQIDNPYIDSSNNGLSYAVERLKTEEITGHIHLLKGERSALADLAARSL
ncbi:MAG: PhoH family protein [Candidatus Schekmanbacteria bacterium]|nr:PhoH family protein [Candidatus Schekmanbacteria bacterium]